MTIGLGRLATNLILLAISGIAGNLIAAWWLQDVWHDFFTPARLVVSFLALILCLAGLALLDYRAELKENPTNSVHPSGVHDNVQFGKNIIRVIKGSNVYGNCQIGSNRIDVIDGGTSFSEREVEETGCND